MKIPRQKKNLIHKMLPTYSHSQLCKTKLKSDMDQFSYLTDHLTHIKILKVYLMPKMSVESPIDVTLRAHLDKLDQ